MTKIIDGKSIAGDIRSDLRSVVQRYTAQNQRVPYLSVILVGNDPASKIYVGHKEKACKDVGIQTKTWHLDAQTEEQELLNLIQSLNQDDQVDGILLQLPLPAQINKTKAISSIHPLKDVDGLTPVNQGLLSLGLPSLTPCTPMGIMKLIQSTQRNPEGLVAAVIGRSPLVGSPVSKLLTHANATVLTIHSRSSRPEKLCKQADIVIAAAGVHKLVTSDWIKPGAVVIDVGIHRDASGKLAGDVDFDAVSPLTSHITPVPGGVGPMTIACLLANCIKAYEWRQTGDHPYVTFS